MIDISIIIVTYNSKWFELKATIKSVLMQKGINYEIIFADDGSKIKWNEKIREYVKGDYNYCFADSNINVGTVSNIINALKVSKGKYIKVISPGDCLNGKLAIKKWIDFMEKERADLSFCNAIYYKKDNAKKIEVLKEKSSPKNVNIYHKRKNKGKLFVDYLLANDTILGAAVLAKRNIILKYLLEMEGKVKYVEDYMIRLMIFDNKKICHMDKNLIWYEYGDGISTTKNNKWAKLLYQDFEGTNEIIKNRKNIENKMQKKYQKYLIDSNYKWMPRKVKKVLLFPGMIFCRIKMKLSHNNTPFEDEKKLEIILQDNVQ